MNMHNFDPILFFVIIVIIGMIILKAIIAIMNGLSWVNVCLIISFWSVVTIWLYKRIRK